MKKPRLLTKIPRNPDDTKKPRSSGKNPAVATLVGVLFVYVYDI